MTSQRDKSHSKIRQDPKVNSSNVWHKVNKRCSRQDKTSSEPEWEQKEKKKSSQWVSRPVSVPRSRSSGIISLTASKMPLCRASWPSSSRAQALQQPHAEQPDSPEPQPQMLVGERKTEFVSEHKPLYKIQFQNSFVVWTNDNDWNHLQKAVSSHIHMSLYRRPNPMSQHNEL